MEKTYYINLDSALLAYSVLKRLGSGRVDSFEERLRSQKIQYLAQVFGISPKYPFGLYLRGPYSPTLTSDLFKLEESGAKAEAEEFTPEELEDRFTKASEFIKGKTTRELELVATLHWLKNVAAFSDEEAFKKLTEMKKATPGEIKKTVSYLKEL